MLTLALDRGCTAIEELEISNNHVTGGIEPLKGCTLLRELDLSHNWLSGGLESLYSCTALQFVYLLANEFVASYHVKAYFEKQCQLFRV